jgi:hypothetical protein
MFAVLEREDPAWGNKARPFAAAPHARLGEIVLSPSTLVVHEQRKNQNDRKRNSE